MKRKISDSPIEITQLVYHDINNLVDTYDAKEKARSMRRFREGGISCETCDDAGRLSSSDTDLVYLKFFTPCVFHGEDMRIVCVGCAKMLSNQMHLFPKLSLSRRLIFQTKWLLANDLGKFGR